jgi:hypothetical protein
MFQPQDLIRCRSIRDGEPSWWQPRRVAGDEPDPDVGLVADGIRRRSQAPARRGSLTDGGSTDGAATFGRASGTLGSSGG